jgi:hypothetical protein
MVIRINKNGGRRGILMVELLVAIAILATAILPLAYSVTSEKRFARAAYQRAVAMEIVDGEAEILAAGAWTNFATGSHPYLVQSLAATNLPPGQFTLTIQDSFVRLEWKPDVKQHGGGVVREFRVP